MILPESLKDKTEWTILGPMGPVLPESLLRHPVLAVDGGANFHSHPSLWIGDHDSYSGKISGISLPNEKNGSDLSVALDILKGPRPLALHLWGFLGGRRDHELFNLGEALSFLHGMSGSTVAFYDHQGRTALKLFSQGTWTLTHEGCFSIGTVAANELTLTGNCKYELKQLTPLRPLSSLGLSNEAWGPVSLTCRAPLFVCFPEEV